MFSCQPGAGTLDSKELSVAEPLTHSPHLKTPMSSNALTVTEGITNPASLLMAEGCF